MSVGGWVAVAGVLFLTVFLSYQATDDVEASYRKTKQRADVRVGVSQVNGRTAVNELKDRTGTQRLLPHNGKIDRYRSLIRFH